MNGLMEEDTEVAAQRLGRELRDLAEDDDEEFRQEKEISIKPAGSVPTGGIFSTGA